jgi:antirestriction protein ArdC
MNNDVYERITNRIIEALEQGVRPWVQPWSTGHASRRIMRPLRANGVPYRGINVLMLWSEASERRYASPTWMTFKQAGDLNAHVRKGERGSLVVYASKLTRMQTDENGKDAEREIAFMKGYTVFNVEQIEGLPEQYYAKPEVILDPVARIAHADAFTAAIGANIQHGGGKAGYNLVEDRLRMPLFESFRDAPAYYATLIHELTHWTRHPKRLDRDFGRKRYGDEGYAREELVAELGAAFLCADLNLTPDHCDDHAAYIGSWLKVLKNDKRAVFAAASHAQRAADYLHELQPNTSDTDA